MRASAFMVGLLFLSTIAHASPADSSYHVCGIDKDRFIELAMPGYAQPYTASLVKWQTPPRLIVLSPENRIKGTVDAVFEQLERDGLASIADPVFALYESPDTVASIVEKMGPRNLFVFVDRRGFTVHSDETPLASELRNVLHSTTLTRELLEGARKSQHGSIRAHVAKTGEVTASAGLINPDMDDKLIASSIYSFYYLGLAPIPALMPSRFASAIFEANRSTTMPVAWELSETGHSFFNILLDPKIPAGAHPAQFTACDR